MAQFLTTAGVSAKIEEIVVTAKTTVVLLCPYWDLSEIFFDRLQDADQRKVKIVVVYGKNALKDQVMAQFSSLSNLGLYYCENLHAKCYFNEDLVLITSMNILEFSERKNREMGLCVTKEQDKELFDSIVKEAKSILYASEKVELGSTMPQSGKRSITRVHEGFCLRCGARIRYDTWKPYCIDCYRVWAEFENSFYEESYCHKCGNRAPTSMDKPLCYPCYQGQ